MFRRSTTFLVSLAPPASVAFFFLFRSLTPPGSRISFKPKVSDEYLHSKANSIADANDDELILARLVKGFFNGRAFAIESWVLGTMKVKLVNLRTPVDRAEQQHLWFPKLLPSKALPPLNSVLSGGFQLIDSSRDTCEHDTNLPRTFAAWGFGSNRPDAGFVGVHRLSLVHEGDDILLRLESIACNPHPVKGKEGWSKGGVAHVVIKTFHNFYARVLLADAVDAVCAP